MSLPQTIEEVDPKYLVDWLVIQHTCEWCDGDIVDFNGELKHGELNHAPVTQRQWRCREVKKNGYVSKHWKHWLICRRCAAPHDFGRWVFPIIRTVMPEHEALSAIMEVQPMNAPAGEIMYMDFIHGPDREEGRVRGRMRERAVLDDEDFRVTPEHARAYAERPLDPANYVALNLCGEVGLPEPDQPNHNGRVYAEGAVTYKKWKLA